MINRMNHFRNLAKSEYNDLKINLKQLQAQIDEGQKHPTSEYDELISKQSYFNETLKSKVCAYCLDRQ